MTASPAFDLRLVAYTPLGGRGAVIPDLGFTVSATDAGPTLQATISGAVYGTLPTNLEIAVEWWKPNSVTPITVTGDGTASTTAATAAGDGTASGIAFLDDGDGTATAVDVTPTGAWMEGRDSRFAVTLQDYDDRDLTQTVQITALGIGAYLLAANSLAGVEPYQANGNVEAAASKTNVSVSGSTFTWPTHILADGDRVKIVAPGNAKGLTTGSVYYVRNPTASTFQLSATPGGTIKSCGTATNVSMQRVRTRIVFTGSHQFAKSQAISTTGASGSGLTDGQTYYVVNPTPATIQVASQPGGIPIELTANALTVYRNLDGQRVFTNAHPGTVMSSVFLEARSRGWGVGQDGVTQLLHSWTTGADSTGALWATMADDATTPGISVGFNPGTPGTQILQFMLDNKYAEWYTSNGRTLGLVNYGTGNDHSLGPTPMRIGTTASSVKVQTDITAMRNAFTVRGTGPVIQQVDGIPGAWGRLEVYETASGATSNTLARKQGQTDLAGASSATVAYTVTELAQEAAWLPLVNYSRGDWIACQLKNSGWSRLRCVAWTFTKAPNAGITVTVGLENVRPTLIRKLAKKSQVQVSGISATGSGQSLLESDNRKAAYPLGLTATSVGGFANDGSAVATVTVSWLPVTADINGGDISAVDYDVWVRPEGAFNGQSVARTSATTVDVGPYPSNKVLAISVRARSGPGTWGELSPELEVTTVYPVAVPNPPTDPTISGKLGSVRVAWDGNLVDPTLGPTAPEPGFAYVYAAYSITQTGAFTPAGANMGNAGYTPITGLSVGSTYWFALFAVNTVGVVSAMSNPVQFTVVGVQGPDIEANSVTANSILAGAISADKLDLGTVPQGNPVNRVPMPLTQQSYWSKVIDPTNSFSLGGASLATATTTGITLAPTSSAPAYCYVANRTMVPQAGKLQLSGLSTGAGAVFQVKYFTSAADLTGTLDTAVPIDPSGAEYVFPAGAVAYSVKIMVLSGGASQTVESGQVFEVIGGGGGGQAAELSPSGLRLYDDNGVLALDLTTATQQFLNIYDNTGAEPVSVAAIDDAGNAQFSEVSGSGFDLNGSIFTDTSDPASLVNSSPNGGGWGDVALLDRLGRGVVYDVTWPSQDGTTVSTPYKRIAQDVFQLEDGRQYMLDVQLAGMGSDLTAGGVGGGAAAGVNCYVELQLNLAPNASIADGLAVNRAVVYNNMRGYWAMTPGVWTASALQTTIDATNRILPANVPIYWQVNYNMSVAPTGALTIAEFGHARGFTVIDIGSAYPVRPGFTDHLADVHDYSTSGASSGTSSSGTVAKSTTSTWNAAWSRTWNQSGANIVTGTGQYTNGAAMYQGNGVTPMGSKFGFPALGISGKTITGCQIYLRNTYMAYSGKSALLGSHGDSSAPATYTGSRANPWSVGWGQGQGKWITVPSSLWSSIASGSIRGFSLGVDGSNGNYAYFQGATQGDPPKLRITYH